MKYILAMYQPEGPVPAPEELAAIMADVTALREEMVSTGVFVTTAGLMPTSTSTVVQGRKGDRPIVSDGPFIESKEYVGGFTIIDVADLDGALEWARRLSEATWNLPIEIRPVVFHA